MVIERVEEFKLTQTCRAEISVLLGACFSQYPVDQVFINQVPHFRLLVYSETGSLIGHLAVDYRMINDNGKLVSVFGVSDVCVDPAFRRQGIGTALMQYLESLGKTHGVGFLVLIAAEQEWYLKQGFLPIDGTFKWLMIRNAQSLGIISRRLDRALMVKALGARKWEPGGVDFLGTIF